MSSPITDFSTPPQKETAPIGIGHQTVGILTTERVDSNVVNERVVTNALGKPTVVVPTTPEEELVKIRAFLKGAIATSLPSTKIEELIPGHE